MVKNSFHGQLIADRFQIRDLERDLLGRGSMGDVVYRARDTETGELVEVHMAMHNCSTASTRSSGFGTTEIGQLARAILATWPTRGRNLCASKAVYALVSLQ